VSESVRVRELRFTSDRSHALFRERERDFEHIFSFVCIYTYIFSYLLYIYINRIESVSESVS
jgi:hypothetical protein